MSGKTSENQNSILVLLRHASTDLNSQGKLQGKLDPPLNKKGIEEAKLIGEHIRSRFSIDHILSSPSQRALQTLEHGGFDVSSIQTEESLREMHYGEMEGRDVASVSAEMIKAWQSDINYAPLGGESMLGLFNRVSEACEDISLNFSGRTVLVCSHATPIKASIVWSLGGDASMILKIHSHPASVSVIAKSVFGRVLLKYNEKPLPD